MNLIVVSPHGRSGSLFIQSLFDGHPQVVTFPTHKLDYPAWDVAPSAKECLVNFIEINSHLFEEGVTSIDGIEINLKRRLLKSGQLSPPIDVHEFVQACKIEFGGSWGTSIVRRDFVIGVHKAYARLQGYDVSAIKYLLFHLHGYRDQNHERALSDFPDMKFIAMTRDPRETWLSSDREWARSNADAGIDYMIVRPLFFVRVMLRYKKAIEGLVSFSEKLRARNVVVVDLNKFHELNRTAMTRLAQWLEIDFTEALMESTFGRAPWLGNASDKKSISGFDVKRSVYSWPSDLCDRDRDSITHLLAREIGLLGYPSAALTSGPTPYLEFPHWAYVYLRRRELTVMAKGVFKKKTGIRYCLGVGSAMVIGVLQAVRDYFALVRQVRHLNADAKANVPSLRICGWRLH